MLRGKLSSWCTVHWGNWKVLVILNGGLLSCHVCAPHWDLDRCWPLQCTSKVAEHALLFDLDSHQSGCKPLCRLILSLEHLNVLSEKLLLLLTFFMIYRIVCNRLRALLSFRIAAMVNTFHDIIAERADHSSRVWAVQPCLRCEGSLLPWALLFDVNGTFMCRLIRCWRINSVKSGPAPRSARSNVLLCQLHGCCWRVLFFVGISLGLVQVWLTGNHLLVYLLLIYLTVHGQLFACSCVILCRLWPIVCCNTFRLLH